MSDALRTLFCLNQKFLLWNMVSRNIKIRYRRSSLGYIWSLLVPLSTAAIYYFLFKIVFRVAAPDFAAYVITGILIWTFFSSTLAEGMESVISNFNLLLQVNISLNVFPLTTAVTNLVTLLFSFPVIILACLVSNVSIGLPAVFFIYYIGLLFLQAYCLSYALSIAVIYLRDLKQAIGFVTQIWMYVTPVLYQVNLIPERYTWILYVNPVGRIFTGIHNCLLRATWPTTAEIFVPLAWSTMLLSITLVLHIRTSKKAIERI